MNISSANQSLSVLLSQSDIDNMVWNQCKTQQYSDQAIVHLLWESALKQQNSWKDLL